MKTMMVAVEVTVDQAGAEWLAYTAQHGFASTVQPVEPEPRLVPATKKPRAKKKAKPPVKSNGLTASGDMYDIVKNRNGVAPRQLVEQELKKKGFSPTSFHAHLQRLRRAGLAKYEEGAVRLLHGDLERVDVEQRIRHAS